MDPSPTLDLGGQNFVALATTLNFALTGWEDFIQRIAAGEKRLEEKIASGLLSIQDHQYKAIFSIVCTVMFGSLWRSARKVIWHIAYYFCVLAVIWGIIILYLGKTSSYDGLLILPSAVQFAVGRAPLLVAVLVIGILKRVIPGASASIAGINLEARRVSEMANTASATIPRPTVVVPPRRGVDGKPL